MDLKPVTAKLHEVVGIAATVAGKIYGPVRNLALVGKVETWATRKFEEAHSWVKSTYQEANAWRIRVVSWISCKVSGACDNPAAAKVNKVAKSVRDVSKI